MQRTFLLWISLLILTAVASIAGTTLYLRASMKERLIVSTTTSLYDTGLLDAVEAEFETEYSIDLNFISVGTGIAIQHAQRGDADLVLVHSPADELKFLTDGTGVNRKIIAYNFFAIVGPETDPATIGNTEPLQALSKIVESGRNGTAKWVSRGDNSGTNAKENILWAAAGFDWKTLSQESWYINAGSGMGETLKKADYFSAYTLADMGTYLKYNKDGLISLRVLVGQGKDLLNVYSAIAVNQTLHPSVNFDSALTFTKFLVSDEGQQIIEQYGKDAYGQSLFYPAARLLKVNTDPSIAHWIAECAFFNGTECPLEYRKGNSELYG